FTPEGALLGYNCFYFENAKASALAKEFTRWHAEKFKEWPNYESDHGYFTVVAFKAAVERAAKAAGGKWPSQDAVIQALEGVAAGLQLVFGVTKILNLACGSFYALGAYAGVSAVRWALGAGLPAPLFLPVLLGAGLALAVIGPVIERLLRPIYDRDESFQLLLTFALVLMFEDVIRFFWGTA